MIKKVFTVLLIIYALPLFSHPQAEIDSLKKVISEGGEPAKTAALIELSKAYWEISPKKSIEYARKALSLAEKNSDIKNKVGALLSIAVSKFYIGDNDSSIYFSKKAIESASKKIRDRVKGFAYNLISLSYSHSDNYSKALEYAFKSYAIRKESTDTVNIAGSIDNIAHIYAKMGKYEESLQYSLKALHLFEKVNDTLEIAKTLASIANLYRFLDKTEISKRKYFEAKRLLEDKSNTMTYVDILSNLGIIYLDEGKFDSALFYFNSALPLYDSNDLKEGVAETYLYTGISYAEKKTKHPSSEIFIQCV